MKIDTLKVIFAFAIALTFLRCERDAVHPRNDEPTPDDVRKVMILRKELGRMQSFVDKSLVGVFFKINSGGKAAFRKTVAQQLIAFRPCADSIVESDHALSFTINFGDGCHNYDGAVLSGEAIITMDFLEDLPVTYQVKLINYQEIYSNEDDPAKVNGEYTGRSFTVDTINSLFYFQQIDQRLNMSYKKGPNAMLTSSEKIKITDNIVQMPEYTSDGLFSNGDKFSTSTVKTLIYNLSCDDVALPVKGIEALTFNDSKAEIDYGNGECDNDYIVNAVK